MSLLNYFRLSRNKKTAEIAKERLQIIVAHQRRERSPNRVDLQGLQQRLVEVIAEYLNIPRDKVIIELEKDENRAVLELNVVLPEELAS